MTEKKIPKVRSVEFNVSVEELPEFNISVIGFPDISMIGDIKIDIKPSSLKDACFIVTEELKKEINFIIL